MVVCVGGEVPATTHSTTGNGNGARRRKEAAEAAESAAGAAEAAAAAPMAPTVALVSSPAPEIAPAGAMGRGHHWASERTPQLGTPMRPTLPQSAEGLRAARDRKSKQFEPQTDTPSPSPALHPTLPTLKLGFCDRDPRVRRRSLGTKW